MEQNLIPHMFLQKEVMVLLVLLLIQLMLLMDKQTEIVDTKLQQHVSYLTPEVLHKIGKDNYFKEDNHEL
jgi:hypothetical protein